jgi:hypothetical protein
VWNRRVCADDLVLVHVPVPDGFDVLDEPR